MNYTEFIKKADQAMESMPAEKLAAFLHDHARRIPEYKREEFLGRLYAFSNQDLEEGHIQKLDAHDRESLLEEISKMMERLESIDDGEVTMLEVLNEEYDDWYGYEGDEDNEEFYYEDPENICESINHACSLLHECVDREMYQECYELADFLLQMEVFQFLRALLDQCFQSGILFVSHNQRPINGFRPVWHAIPPIGRQKRLHYKGLIILGNHALTD